MGEKIIGIGSHEIEVPIARHHIVMQYEDRPGIVATYGSAFGDAGINIAGMAIARDEAGGRALSILTVDSAVPDALLDTLRAQIAADYLVEIDIIDT
jgi:D-3-phosphoglycerate dehydrogenase